MFYIVKIINFKKSTDIEFYAVSVLFLVVFFHIRSNKHNSTNIKYEIVSIQMLLNFKIEKDA